MLTNFTEFRFTKRDEKKILAWDRMLPSYSWSQTSAGSAQVQSVPCIPSFAYKKVIGRLATRNLPVLLAAACGQGGKAGHEEVQPMYT